VEDLLARWESTAWQAEVDGWVADVLAARGERPTGPAQPLKTRFWSVVRRYDTTAGTVWFKECNPGQAFEGPLLQELSALEPDSFPAPLAVDAGARPGAAARRGHGPGAGRPAGPGARPARGPRCRTRPCSSASPPTGSGCAGRGCRR
jgi:hypothetical protein